jgi:hypothetical protein
MTVLGKKIAGFFNKVGSKFSYDNMKQVGNKIVKGVDNGLKEVKHVGDIVNKGLGSVVNIADKLRNIPVIGETAALVGSGASKMKSMVSLGTMGVDKLEKMIVTGKEAVKNTPLTIKPISPLKPI